MAYTNIDDPSAYFQTALYTGTGNANNAITNDGNSYLQPDWIWFKSRDAGHSHYVVDSSRGRDKGLYPDVNNLEVTSSGSTTDCQSFDTDGFTVGTPEDANSTNSSSSTKVAWQWKCNGGTTSTNTDGDINSTVQVNSDAGFSIVTDSPSNNTARSIGHGLGVAPQVVIRRARTRVENWRVFHSAAGSTGALTLDGTVAYNSTTTLFTGVTSTTFGVGTDFSVNGNYSYVSYCFAEKQGYSKFGKYVGNGSTDGAFVYTGFKPAWLMVKRTDGVTNWRLFDSKRSGFNGDTSQLYPNLANAEDAAGDQIDLLSNGFKNRTASGDQNISGASYIYMAFAENPFTTSTGIPTTAR
jgi:hypothetical protein